MLNSFMNIHELIEEMTNPVSLREKKGKYKPIYLMNITIKIS